VFSPLLQRGVRGDLKIPLSPLLQRGDFVAPFGRKIPLTLSLSPEGREGAFYLNLTPTAFSAPAVDFAHRSGDSLPPVPPLRHCRTIARGRKFNNYLP